MMMSKYYLTDPFAALDKMFADSATKPSYPPYNIIKLGDNDYVLEFAVAGFKKDNININVEKSVLSIKGEKKDHEFAEGDGYLHKGIAGRKFSRSFALPEYVEVSNAWMEDGILHIGLTKNVPEEQKPKQITIN